MSLSQVNKEIKYLKSFNCSFGDGKRKRESQSSTENSESQEICSICSEPLTEDVTQLNCGHQFHKICICQWFVGGSTRKFTCPMCRAESRRTEIDSLCPRTLPPQREPPPARRRISFDPEILNDPALRQARDIPQASRIQDDGDW